MTLVDERIVDEPVVVDLVAHNREQPLLFGKFQQLVGILHQPSEQALATERTAVLMVTPGMLHSCGPFRLHRDLALALGKLGFCSLRFDLSGIGESLAVGASGTSLDRARQEISAAIDVLENEYGVRDVVLFGLCSGADDAFYTATQDDRIAGLYLVDGLGFRTRGYYWHRLVKNILPKLFRCEAWLTQARKLFGLGKKTPASLKLADDIREFPSRMEALQQIQSLIVRGVEVHFHYTGGVRDYYNHAGQFAAMFPELSSSDDVTAGKLSTSFNQESDHVAYLCEHRAELVRRVCRKVMKISRGRQDGQLLTEPKDVQRHALR